METLNSFTKSIEIGEYRNFGRISMAPLDVKFFKKNKFKTLSDLIKISEVDIRELSSSGSVNEVLVENKSKDYLIIFDTDIITGAKQNRVSALSLIIAPHSRIQFPVYCIERSRWGYSDSYNFSGSRFSVGPSIRSK
ncbi:MAG: ARPP-1 family domain-containing protein, partial [Candidatus Micropelagos sp.]